MTDTEFDIFFDLCAALREEGHAVLLVDVGEIEDCDLEQLENCLEALAPVLAPHLSSMKLVNHQFVDFSNLLH